MKISVFYEHIVEAASQTGESISEICRDVAAHSISYVEIEDRRINEKVIQQLLEAGIGVSCIYGFFDLGHRFNFIRRSHLLKLAKKTGADKVLIIPGFKIEGEDEKALLETMRKRLIRFVKMAKRQGITVIMEDFDDCNAPFATAKQLLWFMEQVPDLKFALDTGNFLYSEEDVKEGYRMLKPYLAHVHCKDRSLLEKEGEEPKITISGRALYSSAVGYGCIPMKELVNELLEVGYDGIYAIEHFGSKKQYEDMIKSAEWLLSQEQMLRVKKEKIQC